MIEKQIKARAVRLVALLKDMPYGKAEVQEAPPTDGDGSPTGQDEIVIFQTFDDGTLGIQTWISLSTGAVRMHHPNQEDGAEPYEATLVGQGPGHGIGAVSQLWENLAANASEMHRSRQLKVVRADTSADADGGVTGETAAPKRPAHPLAGLAERLRRIAGIQTAKPAKFPPAPTVSPLEKIAGDAPLPQLDVVAELHSGGELTVINPDGEPSTHTADETPGILKTLLEALGSDSSASEEAAPVDAVADASAEEEEEGDGGDLEMVFSGSRSPGRSKPPAEKYRPYRMPDAAASAQFAQSSAQAAHIAKLMASLATGDGAEFTIAKSPSGAISVFGTFDRGGEQGQLAIEDGVDGATMTLIFGDKAAVIPMAGIPDNASVDELLGLAAPDAFNWRGAPESEVLPGPVFDGLPGIDGESAASKGELARAAAAAVKAEEKAAAEAAEARKIEEAEKARNLAGDNESHVSDDEQNAQTIEALGEIPEEDRGEAFEFLAASTGLPSYEHEGGHEDEGTAAEASAD